MNIEIENKLPKTALSLYVKLFCKKRRSKTKNNKVLIEATQSWLSLSKHEKQQFLKKYNEYQNNIKKALADYLKKTEPYLKVKKKTKIKPHINIVEGATSHNTVDEEIELNTDRNNQSIGQENFQVNVNNSIPFSSPHNDLHDDNNYRLLENTNNSNRTIQDDEVPIAEPTPPKYITGKQLFRMINENEENNLVWDRLNNSQKRKYQTAVFTIKKKYLEEYKKYLEHLPSEKLFHHYKNYVM